MKANDLRQKYLQFFERKEHSIYPSGSLIPYDVTGKLDESLLFNGAGMVQFKPYFRGTITPPNRKLVSSQKCVRTGDIESVGDLSHLTFFEMLGNFSFGDYFKKEAIQYAWDFLTSKEWLALDLSRLCCTVFEEDDEAEEYWKPFWEQAGFDPAFKIFKLGEETNYWPAGAHSAGPPGPCGPNSEIFYWTAEEEPPTGPYTSEDYIRDEAAGKWLEIWNLVFIQYEWQGTPKDTNNPSLGYVKTGMPPLPFQSIDTGMGLERTAAVLAGHDSVYDTDVFAPILKIIEGISSKPLKYGENSEKDRAIRIIADHIRTACFCIADGVLPSNVGRGYVLRRLIRRAVLTGQRVLGFENPFFDQVYYGVVDAVGDHYGELTERREIILETLKNEEALFRKTLASGSTMFQEELAKQKGKKIFPGTVAFRLYDTYGFPLEVTMELSEEAGMEVDVEEYQRAMQETQARSRSSAGMEAVYGELGQEVEEIAIDNPPSETNFVGYSQLDAKATITRIRPRFGAEGKLLNTFELSLDVTPFYAEAGGQVGDQGILTGDGFELHVLNTTKKNNLYWHEVRIEKGGPLHYANLAAFLREKLLGSQVEAVVDKIRRRDTESHHTTTHLLHAALRKVLGKHVTQAGSLVAPDYLRFDFTHGKSMTPEELTEVERIVNEHILANEEVHVWQDLPIEEARKRGAMALFGEKYGDRVRMIQIDEFSLELCGGTHLPRTGHAGFFKIIHEGSAASGIRRIEAIASHAAYHWVNEQYNLLKQAAALVKSNPHELVSGIERVLNHQKELNRRLEKLRSQAADAGEAHVEKLGDIELVTQKIQDGEMQEATHLADRLIEGHPNRAVLVALSGSDKPGFVCKVGSEAQKKGVHAGNLIREIAKLAGGGGGGRPDFATAGAKDPSRIDTALEAAKELLNVQISGK